MVKPLKKVVNTDFYVLTNEKLQDCKCFARSCQHHNNPQPICSPEYGAEEKVHNQDVQISWKIKKSFFGHFTLTPSPIALKVPVYRTFEV